jgi:hypothetical protein
MIKEASDTAESVDRRTKIQALSLAKDVYALILRKNSQLGNKYIVLYE